MAMTKAAVGPGAPRMGSLRIARRRRVRSLGPPAFGHGTAVARRTGLCRRPVPAPRVRKLSFRFSARKTRRVLATRHPFAETAQAPVRCLRLCEPPRPKQPPGAWEFAFLAQSLIGGIRRQENRVDLSIPGVRRGSRICRPPAGTPLVCAPLRGSRGCGFLPAC